MPCWDEESQKLLDNFNEAPSHRQNEAANNLVNHINEKRRERWRETVQNIDFTHSSRQAWSLLNRLTGKHSNHQATPISANKIASRLVSNGRYANPDRPYSAYVRGAVKEITRN